MAKPKLSTLARPKPVITEADDANTRLKELESAVTAPVEEVIPAAVEPEKAPTVQRSREGMVKMSVHVRPEARDALKILAMKYKAKTGSKFGLEDWLLMAINNQLERDEAEGLADFRVT